MPSFCAVAAKLNTGLAEGAQPLHIIPASYQGVEEGLEWSGPKVLMKTGRSMKKVKALLDEKGLLDKAMMVQKCGMEGEEIYPSMRGVGRKRQLLFGDCGRGINGQRTGRNSGWYILLEPVRAESI